ncbi:diacetylchitobiose-6-phosphate hydrolase [Photobacterium iliopiscarium]|jgi:6-phospho-beta-glucosidase|uniref:6-phospho-beta-glucosidase n=1 Tax=Photobacterium iliopiscarium TaxID=56192 RepID=A0A0D8QB64_9GAMM|nr:6-phospho-beta-glucosidase [Photobacterium iliopiscarium]KJG26679.1 diacetylchitobiose-6-phosphate hydrolase [Photobacterium iliopiscarium]MCD9488298.1 6-phospho-beta-glucosidase [Photobacterium iliopiscarium]MCF2245055.1 6-phospho-beta-glucosidase [Photobacterium iliopiscarium]PST96240.1 6-phospho-beta-glucosidase [Photobacterium iliopiscarium]PST99793.1 6-phospho-beta-glucosidase [Photobacterium iliopiscarium]
MNTAKIAIIGGGSSYSPELIEGIIQRWEQIPLHEIALVDVEKGHNKVEIIAALTRRMLDHNGLSHVIVSVHFSPDEAIKGADYVLTQFRVGQLPARAADERLGLKYGLLGQETTGVGGFAKALRTIPVMLDIAKKVEQLAPNAWIINFTNPAGIVTEAVSRYSNAKIIGLCNVPVTMHHMIATMLKADYNDVQLRFAGLNHMVWAHEVILKGENVTNKVIEMLCDGAALTMNNIKEEPWSPEFLRALGAIPCPYHRYFYQTQTMLQDEIKQAANEGTRAEQVMKVEHELFELYQDPKLDHKPEQLSFRGGSFYSEVAIELVCAIHNNLGTRLVVNTTNNGTIIGLPDDAAIETDCIIDSQGAHPLAFGHLPDSMHGLTQQIKAFERLTIEAAVHGNKEAALLALVTNPLIGDAQLAQPILDDILRINAQYLPQFSH